MERTLKEVAMFKHIALIAAGLAAASASADELTSIQGGSIDLGTYRGVVYYVDEGTDFRVVTTLASADGSMPLRFVVTLSEDERFVISVPGEAGGKDRPMEISRSGGKLIVGERVAAAETAAIGN